MSTMAFPVCDGSGIKRGKPPRQLLLRLEVSIVLSYATTLGKREALSGIADKCFRIRSRSLAHPAHPRGMLELFCHPVDERTYFRRRVMRRSADHMHCFVPLYFPCG